jgi:signal peptide peptidase SppA
VKYLHIARYVAETPWAILPSKMEEILDVLAFRAAGHVFSQEEIQARLGATRPATPSRSGAVAVIPIRGTIAHRMSGMEQSSGGVSTESISAMLREALADEQVGTIVFDVDSPGGTVTGLQTLASEIFAARGQKRMIAVANSLMASAAYHIASQADEIVGIPDALVGSIGVFAAHQDLSAMLEKEGVKVTLISAGKFKTEGNPFEPLSDDAKAVMQARVDDAYATFVKDVARGRGVAVSDVRNGYGQGRALSAKDAKAAGLIDRIGTMEDTLSRLVGRKAAGGLRAESEAPEIAAVADVGEVADFSDEEDRARRLRML